LHHRIDQNRVNSDCFTSKLTNVNVLLTFSGDCVHSSFPGCYIWVEYADGKQKRGTGDKLEEKYIIPIARELAIGLKAIHEAGIIHRDIKAANVMIHEKGLLQIIDFGVAGILETSKNKRSTIVGTPHWMPPEMNKLARSQELSYGTEVSAMSILCQ